MNTQTVHTQTVAYQPHNTQPEAVERLDSNWVVPAVTYGVWLVSPVSVSLPLFIGAATCWYAMTHKKEVSDTLNSVSATVCTKAMDALCYVGNKTLEKGSEATSYVAGKAWEKGSEALSCVAVKTVEKSSEAISHLSTSLSGLFKQISYCEPTSYFRSPCANSGRSESEKTVKLKQD